MVLIRFISSTSHGPTPIDPIDRKHNAEVRGGQGFERPRKSATPVSRAAVLEDFMSVTGKNLRVTDLGLGCTIRVDDHSTDSCSVAMGTGQNQMLVLHIEAVKPDVRVGGYTLSVTYIPSCGDVTCQPHGDCTGTPHHPAHPPARTRARARRPPFPLFAGRRTCRRRT